MFYALHPEFIYIKYIHDKIQINIFFVVFLLFPHQSEEGWFISNITNTLSKFSDLRLFFVHYNSVAGSFQRADIWSVNDVSEVNVLSIFIPNVIENIEAKLTYRTFLYRLISAYVLFYYSLVYQRYLQKLVYAQSD